MATPGLDIWTIFLIPWRGRVEEVGDVLVRADGQPDWPQTSVKTMAQSVPGDREIKKHLAWRILKVLFH